MKTKLKHDKTVDDWKLIKEGTKPKKFPKLELVEFLEKGESYINGEEIIKRAVKLKADLNQYHAEYLLEHQDEIPEEWREFCIVFPATVWRHRGGRRYVPCLRWDGDRWYLSFDWLGTVGSRTIVSPARQVP